MNKDSNKDKDEKNNIATHEADINLIKKFLDYANVADASYALLEAVNGKFKDIDNEGKEREKEGDKQNLGDKFNNHNSTYARAIEARFMKDVVLEKGIVRDTTIDNNPINIPIDSTLSTRTKNFVNRYEIRFHQPNTDSGFSATLFYDTQKDIFVRLQK